MPGLNSTGAPDTRDYNLGRGIVRAAKLDATTGLPDSDGFRDLGNAPEFAINVAIEDVRHQSSRTQLKFTDKRCTISQEVGLSFQLDELNFQNLADFFAGTTEVYNNEHDVTWTAHENSIVSASVKTGNWYQLYDEGTGAGTRGTERIYDIKATGVVYEFEADPQGTPVVLVEGTDYEVDAEMGLVRFLPSGAVSDGDEVGWVITTGATTPQDLDQVNALIVGDVVAALLFVSTNACDQGNKTEFLFHRVSLSADGDLSLIGDEITTMNFTGVAEVNSQVPDTSKVLTVRSYDQLA